MTKTELTPRLFDPLPLGAVLPTGWLRDQLRVQAEGLSGHLDEFWPSVADSRWIGGRCEGWERGPYWLDGLVPLAVQLGDARLMGKAQSWIDYILEHQHADGWLGPKTDPHEGTGEVALDPWPQFVLFKAFTQWQEATGDARIIPAMQRSLHRMETLLMEKPLRSWGKMRWADLVLSIHWLYERTSEEWLLSLAAQAHAQGFDWRKYFSDFRATEKIDPAWLAAQSEEGCLPLHGVNNAMGAKSGAVWGRQSGDIGEAASSLHAVEVLDRYHGQVTGVFSGDEHLAGRDPSQGTETCTVTEYLFTLEQMLALTGEPALADRIERIAYNALPAALTADMWARQYDQQPNQVLCSVAPRSWVSNGPYSNLFSLEGNFGCCTANFHQGWPKFAANLWMTTPDHGLAAVAYAPCTVTTEIDGAAVTIESQTGYPFRDEIKLTLKLARAASFPLLLRVPAWAEGATVVVGGQREKAAPGTFHRLSRVWRDGDVITLHLPLTPRLEDRGNGAVAIHCGPLVMALKIEEEFKQVGGILPHADWEVHPKTPWNYALRMDSFPERFSSWEDPISAMPFDGQAPPLSVTAPAQCLPEWTLQDNSAGPVPSRIPAQTGVPGAERVTLIPYGSTRLRISEFPAA